MTSCASPDHKDSTEVSAASIDISISHPTKLAATADTATTASQLPVAPATDSTETETSTDADGATASLPVRLWDRAYDDLKREETDLVDIYEKILSRQLQDGPGSAVPESQPNTIVQNSDARRRQMAQLIHTGLDKTTREATVKEGLGVAVAAVLSARNIISSAIQAVPQAALAWTGVCLVLEVFANPVGATEANRKGIDYVVKRMDWYWSLSSNLLKDLSDHADELLGVRGELENEIVNLYKMLLSYQVKSVCSYYRNRGLVLLRDMIKLDNWDADLGTIRDAEKRFLHDTEIYSAQQATSHLEQLVSHARNQEIQQMSDKDQQCLKHLRLTDPRDDKTRIERTKGGLLQDSYRWVLDNPDFQRWRNHPESRLLWIKGDPGKGKTMLLCGIINELARDTTADTCHCNRAYFFCQATDSRINNAIAVLRGLIYLLLDQQPSLLSHVRSEYDRAGETLFQDANTWDALSRILANILRDPSLRTTYFLIDALDECVTDLPQLLNLIAQKSSGSPRVKWLVSSRNWPEIEEGLETATEKARLSLRRDEAQKRFSLFFSSTSLAGACGGLLASAIGKMDYLRGYRGWRWIFIIEGCFTVLVAVVFFFKFPVFPEQAKWLRDKARLKASQGHSGAERSITLRDVRTVMSDYKIWLGGFMYFGLIVPAYSYAYFAPTIIGSYHYDAITTQLRSVPPWAVAFGFAMLVAVVSDWARHRFAFVMFAICVAISGFAILITVHDKLSVQYAALFLICMGTYSAMPVIVCWFNMNLGGHHRRAIGSAWQASAILAASSPRTRSCRQTRPTTVRATPSASRSSASAPSPLPSTPCRWSGRTGSGAGSRATWT